MSSMRLDFSSFPSKNHPVASATFTATPVSTHHAVQMVFKENIPYLNQMRAPSSPLIVPEHFPLADQSPSRFERPPIQPSSSAFSPTKTPPRAIRRPSFAFSPSNFASPEVTKPPCEYHFADPLMRKLKNREIKKFAGKKAHSVVVESPDRSQVLAIPKVAEFISRASHHIRDKGEVAPPIEEAGVEVSVPSVNQVTLTNTGSGTKQHYEVHSQITPTGQKRKSFFPKSGDGVVTFEKGTGASPSKLKSIIDAFKMKRRKPNASVFVKQKHAELTLSTTQATS